MGSDVKISAYQLMVLVSFFTLGTSTLATPAIIAEQAKQDAWIATLIGVGVGTVIILLYANLAGRFPNKTFFQVLELVFGKWIGKALSLSLTLAALIFTSTLLYYSGEFLNTEMLPNTPTLALNLLMVSVIVMGAYLGLETVARSAEIFFMIFTVLFLLLFVFLLPEVKVENLQPILDSPPMKIAAAAFSYIDVAILNAVFLLVIFPARVKGVQDGKKAFLTGSLIAGLAVLILTTMCILVLGQDYTAKQQYPGYELVKKISIGNFIQRVESSAAMLWSLTLYFKATLYFLFAVLGIAHLLGRNNYTRFTYPFGAAALVLSLVLYPNIIDFKHWNATVGRGISVYAGVAVPLLLAIVYAVRRKGLKKSGKI